MQTKIDGNAVFVCDDNFINLQESNAVFGDTRDFAAAVFTAMVVEGVEKATIIVREERLDYENYPELLRYGKLPKVTIEWVDAEFIAPDFEAQLLVAGKEKKNAKSKC